MKIEIKIFHFSFCPTSNDLKQCLLIVSQKELYADMRITWITGRPIIFLFELRAKKKCIKHTILKKERHQ